MKQKNYILRNLPQEWKEFKFIADKEGISAAEKLRRFIVETVKKVKRC